MQEGLRFVHEEDNIKNDAKLKKEIGSLERITSELISSTQCLLELSSELADLATEHFAEELFVDSGYPHLEIFQVSSPQALTYCRKIRDRFRELPCYLVERLREANAKRAAMIQAAQSKQEEASAKRETPNSTIGTCESPFSSSIPKLTETTKSMEISDPVFDILSSPSKPKITSTKEVSNFKDTASVTTYASYSTSLSAADQGRPRVPPLPQEAERGLPFDCLACYAKLVGITDRRAWKYV